MVAEEVGGRENVYHVWGISGSGRCVWLGGVGGEGKFMMVGREKGGRKARKDIGRCKAILPLKK